MVKFVECTTCHTTLQLPHGAQSIRCAVCHAVITRTTSGARRRDRFLAYMNHYVPPSVGRIPLPGPTQLPSAFGRKRALIIGITYKRTKNELKGCINDARCMKYLLVNRFKFPQESVLMLTEEERDPYRIPTKYNIRMAMHWLMQGVQAGDSLVFHYSGHGLQQRNYTGDEVDGYDETLCPSDFQTQGMIVDNELNATLVRPLPHGAKLHAIIDSCHSGTMLDLPYLCRMDRTGRYAWEDHRPRSGAWKGTSGGEVISFSGCDDHQKSADTDSLSKVISTGAMTFSFIQAIERGQGATYGSILNAIRSSIRGSDSDSGGKIVSSLLSMLITGGSFSIGMRQESQLTSNEPFDVYTRQFSL
ncbi:metacaspase-1-like [Lycium ferocissimum]|uniref:metacaspase-1-like n=1 Tax=Lycium ferocissimum TaxID=112874 RepID=UPI0028150DD3|nr:metacaspase-1-like [Lycium ferocissimum]